MITKTIQPPWQSDVYSADIDPKKSIRLYGTFYNLCKGPKAYDITFHIGDPAEYDSYNFKYTGHIVAISENTVTIEEKYSNGESGKPKHRLDLEHFASHNWDFDADKIKKYNAEESLCI